ncbi:uncharacterized protein LOC142978546 [Anticarsia gemmatalis]|uniref:uncharacterized protein LOC142978546 n=1 Tax=Anticarsia gemmatalis TaxID=129554 RepID=UPI003F7622CD
MRFNVLLLFVTLCTRAHSRDDSDEPVLYYYGREESERSLAACGARQACGALLRRYWRRPALVRLCRCPRRRRCDVPAPPRAALDLNNAASLQFCRPVDDWPECSANENALTVVSSSGRMNPDELEEMHHRNVQLAPPELIFKCRCRSPNYWKMASTDDANVRVYRCSSLHLCKTGEHCGNVSNDLNALYQSCLCPKHHICVHNGGLPHTHISELLYEGIGWKAYCQRVGDEYSYEEY